MYINKVEIKNFRNFKHTEVELGEQMVIVGENKIGKSNLLYALRLILDPKMPESSRILQETDYWDGLSRPIDDEEIEIKIELTGFESNPKLKAVLADYLVANKPLTAGLTYRFYSEEELDLKTYNFSVLGTKTNNIFSYEQRKWLPFEVLSALRDTETDLTNWKKSPLRPLIEKAIEKTEVDELDRVAEEINESTDSLKELDEVKSLTKKINTRLENIVGDKHAIETSLGFSPTETSKLYKAIKMFIDDGSRSINEASLGSANLLYLVLKLISLEQYVVENQRAHTFFAVEEPEAHLHPHLQRLLYKYLLQEDKVVHDNNYQQIHSISNILTTHSPHIASVAPLKSIVLLKDSNNKKKSTKIVSTVNIDLEEKDIEDLERYINVTRGEILFSKGVILVEGDAEEFLLPTFASILGFDLDKYGITVCSVSGTNFLPYIKLLAENGLNLPFSIITDYDPIKGKNPLIKNRLIKLLNYLDDEYNHSACTLEDLIDYGEYEGIYSNDYTLEIDIFKTMAQEISLTLIELATSNKARERAEEWRKTSSIKGEEKTFLSDIERIGKGRFAQRLASNLTKKTIVPSYIEEAINHVVNELE